jgi:hypothetical protein
MGTGGIIDLVNDDEKIIAEVKNKHNTLSGGQLAGLYKTLERLVTPKTSVYKDFTAYYVTVIPKRKKRIDEPFTPSDKDIGSKCYSNQLIRKIDGASFYSLVTGNKHALRDLYIVLPQVIESIGYHIDSPELLTEYFDKAFD